jgi:hypothetical protein
LARGKGKHIKKLIPNSTKKYILNSTTAVMNSTAASKKFFSEKEITITANKNNNTRIN